MPLNYYVGADPGKTGGLVLCREKQDRSGLDVVDGCAMPGTDDEIITVLLDWLPRSKRFYVEAVPKFAGENRSAAFMCVLYGNYRTLTGACILYQRLHFVDLLVEMPLLLWMNRIIPQVDRSREREVRKKQLKVVAMQKWPDWKWTDATCDAPLIAEAGYLLGR